MIPDNIHVIAAAMEATLDTELEPRPVSIFRVQWSLNFMWCKILICHEYLALINRAGGLYGRILTEVVSTDRTQ